MADDKKNIPEAAPPTEAPAPAVETAAVPEQPSPGPALTDAEVVILEHEGQAALFEMGEAVPDPADAVTTPRWRSPPLPKSPRLKRSSRPIPARWWILPPPVTSRPRRRKRQPSRGRPRKKTRLPSPAEAVRPRMARPLPIRPSRPNLGTKSPKASPLRRSLPWIRAALPLIRRSRRSRPRPATPLGR